LRMKPVFLSHRSSVLAVALAVGLPALLAQTARAVSTLPFYEPFSTAYTENEPLGGTTSSNVWDQGNSATGSSGHIRSNSFLAFVGLSVSNGSGGISASTGAGKNRGADFTPQNSGSVYVSFLLMLSNYPAVTPRAFAGLTSGTGTGP